MAGWYMRPNNVHGVFRGHPFYKVLAAGTQNVYEMAGWYMRPNNLHGGLRGHPFYKVLAGEKPCYFCFSTLQNVYKIASWYMRPNNVHGVFRGHPFYKVLAAGNLFFLTPDMCIKWLVGT